MRTTVVCGLLGAGKTTFIRNFTGNVQGRAVVLVNDFGKAGIDGEIISAGGIETIELPSGCVCCTLKFDLITTIKKILENLSPDHLLIEPSGIASPSGVLEALDILGIHKYVVVGIVDATEFVELHEAEMYGRFFEDQIRNSDVILVNKADLTDEDTVSRTISLVELLNPHALIYRTVNAVLPGPEPEGMKRERNMNANAPHLHFETVSRRIPDGIGFVRLQGIFEKMSSGTFGEIVRAKALVNTDRGSFRFDLSYSHLNIVPFEKPVHEGRLVVIGSGIQLGSLNIS